METLPRSVGFDDLGGAANASPPLTTVRNPVVEMATAAVKQLLHLLSKEAVLNEHPAPLVLSPELIVRESTQGK